VGVSIRTAPSCNRRGFPLFRPVNRESPSAHARIGHATDFTMQCNSRASGLLLVKILAALAFVVAAVQHFSPGKHRDGWLVTFANQTEPWSRIMLRFLALLGFQRLTRSAPRHRAKSRGFAARPPPPRRYRCTDRPGRWELDQWGTYCASKTRSKTKKAKVRAAYTARAT
jgi:hypothetical protein